MSVKRVHYEDYVSSGRGKKMGWDVGGPMYRPDASWRPHGANGEHKQQFFYKDDMWITGRYDGKPGAVIGIDGTLYVGDDVQELITHVTVLRRLGIVK